MTPSVTVVIPAFNVAATLAETLRSVTAQSLSDFEVIVVDDGSTDGTAGVAAAFAAADPRFRVHCRDNGGIARARNDGIALARARLIAPLDGDDLWHPTFLARLAALLPDAPGAPALAYAASRVIDARSRIVGAGPRLIVDGFAPYRMLCCRVASNGSAAMFTKAAWERAGGYDPVFHDAGIEGCEDYLFQLRVAAVAPIAAAGAFLVGYRERATGAPRDPLAMARSERLAWRLLRADFPQIRPSLWLWRLIRGHRLLFAAGSYRATGQRARAAAMLAMAALIDPIALATAVVGRRRADAGVADVRFLDADPMALAIDGGSGPAAASPLTRLQQRRLDRVAALDARLAARLHGRGLP